MRCLSIFITCIFLSGCGPRTEGLGLVTGIVTMDGKPLPNAFVQFIPTANGTTSYGKTDAQGRYEMVFSEKEKGAFVGENRVEISTGDIAAPGEQGTKEIVPVEYNVKTTLKADVTSGPNTFDFTLKSDVGRIVQPRAE